jgi:hypothetical protein
MKIRRAWLLAALSASLFVTTAGAAERWSIEKARAWYGKQIWPIGCNYIPSTAINQLEMWQAETFDLPTIDRELGWAQGLGFNTARVFLHDLAWKKDRTDYFRRIERFLEVAKRHKIKVMFVIFDSCWDPSPALGPQRAPTPGVHNSGWVQSPGLATLKDPARREELKEYVKALLGYFQADDRILAWDLFNEPDNDNRSSYGKLEPPNKAELSLDLLRKTFAWAREVDPIQPLTSGVWVGDWALDKASPTAKFQLEQSDVISFHDYSKLPVLQERVAKLRKLDRPLLCTEYMARPMGSTVDPNLGFLREQGIGAYNWGFVDGKSQTAYPWDSWQKPYASKPDVWFHDILKVDGTPYDPKEVAYIKTLTIPAQP